MYYAVMAQKYAVPASLPVAPVVAIIAVVMAFNFSNDIPVCCATLPVIPIESAKSSLETL